MGNISFFRYRNEYIASQAPLPNTINDFWRMIWTQDCSIIAMLIKPNERGTCVYWPSETRKNYEGLIVDLVSEFDMTNYILREFKLTHNDVSFYFLISITFNLLW